MENYIRKLNRKRIVSLILLLLILFSCAPAEEERSKVEKKEFALPVQVGKVVYMDIADEVRCGVQPTNGVFGSERQRLYCLPIIYST